MVSFELRNGSSFLVFSVVIHSVVSVSGGPTNSRSIQIRSWRLSKKTKFPIRSCKGKKVVFVSKKSRVIIQLKYFKDVVIFWWMGSWFNLSFTFKRENSFYFFSFKCARTVALPLAVQRPAVVMAKTGSQCLSPQTRFQKDGKDLDGIW